MKFIFAFIVLTVSLVAGYIFVQIPSTESIKGCLTTTMFNLELCPTSKNYVKLKNISNTLQRTIILTEDSAFYSHNGFDQEGIERCLEKLKETKRITCGGSTITQQLAKNMFLSKDKNFVRKGLEALITVRIEKSLTKKEILERYLNVVQFGKNVYGVKKAAQFYFKKSPSELDAVESAFLAMVLPNPEKYSQSFYRKDLTKFARKRIKSIITDMHRYKSLSELDYEIALTKLETFLQDVAPIDSIDSSPLTSDEVNEMISESNESE